MTQLSVPHEVEAARERVVRLLTDRYADDSLTLDAFEARLDALYRVSDVAALDAMAASLTVPIRRPAEPAANWSTAPAPTPVGARRAFERIAAFMSNTMRRGAWRAPHRLRVAAVMSEVRLDLREADLPAVLEVELLAVMASVKLTVPPGVEVVMDVTPFMAEVADKTRTPPLPGRPRVVVRGTGVMAEVKVVERARDDDRDQ